MIKTNAIRICATAALFAMLGGCASGPNSYAQPVGEPTASKPVVFPEAASAWLKGGSFVDVEQLRRMGPGMTKNQVRELISYPHFDEGLFTPTDWNYLFNFRTGRGDEFISCQYMVRFGNNGISIGTWWKTPDCAAFIRPPEVVIAPKVPILPPPQKVTLSADGLFRFDGAKPSDLFPEARERIAQLVADISVHFKTLHYINVAGHTDRLGMDAYNQALSQARANTVRDLLVQAGIDRAKVRASGMGKRQPVVSDCEGTRATPELVKCLQPNRRVEIEVVGGT